MPENMKKNSQDQPNLPLGHTLAAYQGDLLIFSSKGPWLTPIFALESFLNHRGGDPRDLRVHDQAVGKAALFLLARLGVRRIHADLVSESALKYLALGKPGDRDHGLELSYQRVVPLLNCSTEEELVNLDQADHIYRSLRRKAQCVDGVNLEVQDLSSPFGPIENLSFQIPAGGNLAVVGANGAGKTTLLRHLIGKLRSEKGRVLIDGRPPWDLPPLTVCYVPQHQDNPLFPLSVEEVLILGLQPGERSTGKKISEALGRVGCSHLKNRSFASLSGGEKQRVSLARCLVQRPRIVLLDEPTAALDTQARDRVAEILQGLSMAEMPTMVTVTHDQTLVDRLGWQTLALGAP